MVPLNPLLKAPEVAYHLANSDAEVLITFDLFAEEAHRGTADLPGLTTYVVSSTGAEVPEGTRRFEELIAPVDVPDIEPTNADDTAVLLYTSGTTGKPKGAELTHFQLLMNCTIGGNLLGVEEDDVAVGVLPLFHVFGLSSVLNPALRFGTTIVLVPRFEAQAVVDAIAAHRATIFSGVPTMYVALGVLPLFHVFGLSSVLNPALRFGTTVILVPRFEAQVVVDAIAAHKATIFSGVPTMYVALLAADLEGRDLSSLRVGISGGAAIPGEVIRAFEEKFSGVTILEGYGLSETASTTTFNISAEQRKVLSIGKPVWGVQVRILDEQDRPLPPGPDNVGEIVVRGHNVMKGYYKDPDATAQAMRGGWFRTGDLGYSDEDGYLFVVDRLKDLVIRGGYNVYPREIEEVLYEHPAVAEAAVIGRPDGTLGEEVVAVVSLKPSAAATEQELIAFCKERLAAYKYPREIRFVPELPKGATGKILKKELR
jgi:long-chain acyl-CoA synthetase